MDTEPRSSAPVSASKSSAEEGGATRPRRGVSPAAARWMAGVFAIYSLIVAIGMRPLSFDQDHLRRVALQRFASDLTQYYGRVQKREFPPPLRLPLTAFVGVEVSPRPADPVLAQPAPTSQPPGGRVDPSRWFTYHRFVRWDALSILTLAALGVGLLGWILYQGVRQPFTSKSFRPGSPVPEGSPIAAVNPLEVLLLSDIRNAQVRSENLDRRATAFLVIGLTVAITGAAALYFILPAAVPDPSLTSTLASGIRPFVIGVFVEGVAWFLLRQHRAAMEESRVFYQVYLRRTNYLLAARTIATSLAPESLRTLFVNSLLAELFPDRLVAGEASLPMAATRADGNNLPLAALLEKLGAPAASGPGRS